MIELDGTTPLVWSYNGGEIFTAASTYKLAALMMEAQNIAAGRSNPDGLVCYVDDDYEAGWFDDYADGMCFTRTELAQRAGLFSDNTAGHMLVRDLGGADALNAPASKATSKRSACRKVADGTRSRASASWPAEMSMPTRSCPAATSAAAVGTPGPQPSSNTRLRGRRWPRSS